MAISEAAEGEAAAASDIDSPSLGFGVSFTDTKMRRPQLGQADLPSSKRVLQDLHSSMPASSAGRQVG